MQDFLPNHLELPKSDALTNSDGVWNVLTVSAGAMETSDTPGISKIVNSIIVPLADNDISLFCVSTYQADFILVKTIIQNNHINFCRLYMPQHLAAFTTNIFF